MSDAATSPENGDTQYVVFVVGDLSEAQDKLFSQNMGFAAELIARPITAITVDLRGHYVHPEDDRTDLVGYLEQLSQVLARNVAVRMVYSSDSSDYVRRSFEEVFPEAVYEVVADDRRVSKAAEDDPSEVRIDDVPEVLSSSTLSRLRELNIRTVEDVLGKPALRTKLGLHNLLNPCTLVRDDRAVREVIEVLESKGFFLREDD